MAGLSDSQIGRFHADGYIVVPSFLDAEETRLLVESAHADDRLTINAVHDHNDPQGHPVKLSAWNHPGPNIYGAISRSERIVDAAERLLEDEVYHYHSKMILKEPHEGGAWEWHQDYGYWYYNGCLYPRMLSVAIAVDAATRDNGCMQVLRGSNRLGRIDHGKYDGRISADPERTAEASKRLELVHCELDPGAALFFHANTLHRSAANTTDTPRWSLICCYNARGNDPYKDSVHPRYTPLEKLPDTAIREMGVKISGPDQEFLQSESEGGGALDHLDAAEDD
jgi:ectoine hydroxylase-related dioxygenase (phytanoyl-CoA dioxygenase family)